MCILPISVWRSAFVSSALPIVPATPATGPTHRWEAHRPDGFSRFSGTGWLAFGGSAAGLLCAVAEQKADLIAFRDQAAERGLGLVVDGPKIDPDAFRPCLEQAAWLGAKVVRCVLSGIVAIAGRWGV